MILILQKVLNISFEQSKCKAIKVSGMNVKNQRSILKSLKEWKNKLKVEKVRQNWKIIYKVEKICPKFK